MFLLHTPVSPLTLYPAALRQMWKTSPHSLVLSLGLTHTWELPPLLGLGIRVPHQKGSPKHCCLKPGGDGARL